MDLSVKLQKTVTEDESSINSVNVHATVETKNGNTTTTLEHLTVSIEELELGWTLPGLNFNPESKLHLILTPKDEMEIFVTTSTGETFSLLVDSSDTVGDVKDRFFKMTGQSPSQKIMLYHGKLLEDHQILGYYYIEKDSTLVIRMKGAMLIYVKTVEDETFVLEVLSSDTVDDVMSQIHEIVGTNPIDQVLYVAGERLVAHKTLKDSDIKDGTVVRLLPLSLFS